MLIQDRFLSQWFVKFYLAYSCILFADAVVATLSFVGLFKKKVSSSVQGKKQLPTLYFPSCSSTSQKKSICCTEWSLTAQTVHAHPRCSLKITVIIFFNTIWIRWNTILSVSCIVFCADICGRLCDRTIISWCGRDSSRDAWPSNPHTLTPPKTANVKWLLFFFFQVDIHFHLIKINQHLLLLTHYICNWTKYCRLIRNRL